MQKLEPFSITLTAVDPENIQIEVPIKKICYIQAAARGVKGSFIFISGFGNKYIPVQENIEEIKKLCEPTIFFKGEKLC